MCSSDLARCQVGSLIATYHTTGLGFVESDVEFSAAASNGKILAVDCNTPENLPSASWRRLAGLFGTDLKRKQTSTKQGRYQQPTGIRSCFHVLPLS